MSNPRCNTAISAEFDLVLYRHDSLSLAIPILDPDGGAYDLTAFDSFLMQIKSAATDESPLDILSSANGRISVDGNILTLTWSSTENNQKAGEYVYDVRATAGTAETTILAGSLEVVSDVTRA